MWESMRMVARISRAGLACGAACAALAACGSAGRPASASEPETSAASASGPAPAGGERVAEGDNAAEAARSLAGAGAADCGRAEWGGGRAHVDECVVATMRGGRQPFYAGY